MLTVSLPPPVQDLFPLVVWQGSGSVQSILVGGVMGQRQGHHLHINEYTEIYQVRKQRCVFALLCAPCSSCLLTLCTYSWDRVLSVYLQIFIGLSCGRVFCAAICNQPCNMPILSINMLNVAKGSVDVQINSVRYFLLEIEQGP